MRAVVVREFGGPEALELVEMALPRPGRGQVRVRVAAAGVNPVDAVTRAGTLAVAGLMAPRAVTGIGWDVAGTVDAVGPGVTGVAPGQRVVGLRDRLDVDLGTYADHVVLDADVLAPAPAGLSLAAAATLPLNGLTALQALDLLDLPAGSTLMVTGAAGGVGGFAVELATLRGLRVVALAGEDDEQLVRSLGAQWFVPRGVGDVAAAVRELVPGGVNGAVDAALLGVRALGAVRGRGAFVAVAGGSEPVGLRGIRVANVWITADGPALGRLAALAGDGRLTLRVADTLPLEQAAQAHRRLADGGLRGRLVLTP
ncbi:NADPH:quinone reductase-like Zn-dependent oxidoreductase [Streptomyces sp. 1114.5]|uniref:NADP-dependent oxidoreductase n=1 Tax=Streptomyces sp. 1114.5 TaxID=1938830 RepID=UPI000EB09E33|nr:NADP-dependent oxidoreductase [Streptomyces sp. 1114.5]RKT08688.1 NADPH:quinone reductase-like Zn-dependent oxidoreductase [Streptomyces sp. 1114.5]